MQLLFQGLLPLGDHGANLGLDVVGQSGGGVAPAGSGQHMVDDDELAQSGHFFVGEEHGEPHDGKRRVSGHREVFHAPVIVGGGVVAVVEGQVHDQSQGRGSCRVEVAVADVGGVADVAEEDFHGAGSAAPGHGAGLCAVGFRLYAGQAEERFQHVADSAVAAAGRVGGCGLGEDFLPGDLVELEGDDGVFGVRGDDDFGEFHCPGTYCSQRRGHGVALEHLDH